MEKRTGHQNTLIRSLTDSFLKFNEVPGITNPEWHFVIIGIVYDTRDKRNHWLDENNCEKDLETLREYTAASGITYKELKQALLNYIVLSRMTMLDYIKYYNENVLFRPCPDLTNQLIKKLYTPENWRRERDSNPRYAMNVYTLSRRAPSTTRTPLRTSHYLYTFHWRQ